MIRRQHRRPPNETAIEQPHRGRRPGSRRGGPGAQQERHGKRRQRLDSPAPHRDGTGSCWRHGLLIPTGDTIDPPTGASPSCRRRPASTTFLAAIMEGVDGGPAAAMTVRGRCIGPSYTQLARPSPLVPGRCSSAKPGPSPKDRPKAGLPASPPARYHPPKQPSLQGDAKP